jgi:hypothetical protein
LKWILAYIYSKSHKYLEKNLLSDNPSILFFQIYKILYMCYLGIDKKA